jgi:hypothetical protein
MASFAAFGEVFSFFAEQDDPAFTYAAARLQSSDSP